MENLDKISNYDWNFEIKVFEVFKLVCKKHVWGALKRTFHISSWISQNVWFCSFIQNSKCCSNYPWGWNPGKVPFSLNFRWFYFLKTLFNGSFSNFLYFVEIQQNRKNVFLTNFRLKIMLFFIWPEISKYWLDCKIPKYGNAKQHFNFPFSWVKPVNSSYFAQYFREFTPGTWLGTP